MTDLLFLAHRIPYPPDKGDKIRSWHIFKHLAARFRLHLGCFVDDADDWRHCDRLRELCADSHFVGLSPTRARLRSLTGLATREALSLAYYRDGSMARWVDRRLAAGIKRVFLYSSPMAQYVLGRRGDADRTTVMDFVDVDSDKWRQYSERKPWPLSALYRREGRRLLAHEARIAEAVTASFFVSPAEAALFQSLAPASAAKVHHLNNGVDFDYFSPARAYDNPLAGGGPTIVFTGAMDYWANVDAVTWFAEAIFPVLRARVAEARFVIVGGKPTPAVRGLGDHGGVTVTGRVPDVRPYLAHATLAVAPLRIARGVQNKVLEAMAMARQVVATRQAVEGIDARPGTDLLVAGDAGEFIEAALDVLEGRADPAMGERARARVVAHYDWPGNMTVLDGIFAPVGDRNHRRTG